MLNRAVSNAASLAAAGALLAVPALPAAASVQAGPAASSVSSVSAVADEIRDQQQWVFDMLNVQPAWDAGDEGSGVTVAVIDSGVYPDISDLSGSVDQDSPNYTGVGTPASSPEWGQHGTWMASIIAGHGHDGGYDGIMGIAPEAQILSIRVIPDSNDPDYKAYDDESEQQIQDELAEGIDAAVAAHVQVISMSIGYSAPSGVVRAALQEAYAKGIVLVASAGNSGDNDEQTSNSKTWAPVSFPAEYPGVISVGAVNSDGEPASFSSGNLSVEVAAPGEDVPAQGRDGLYYTVDGTSPACALVAGVAALIKSRYPSLSPALVEQALTSTAQPTSGGYNVLTGFGIVNADAALVEAGTLAGEKQGTSPAPASAHFGGGAAAVPAAPVRPRGSRNLVLFAAAALLSFAVLAGGSVVLYRSRFPVRQPRHG